MTSRSDVEAYDGAVPAEVVPEGAADVEAREGDVGLAEFLAVERPDAEVDSTAAYRDIVEQIMSSESVDEVLTPIEATSAREMIGVPLMINGVSINRSEYDVGSPYYLSVQCADPTDGHKLVVNVGHQGLMAQLIRIGQLDGFPVEAVIYEAGRAKPNGSIPLRLRKVDH